MKKKKNNNDHKKFPNLFYCFKNNVSQPFIYLNDYDNLLFNDIKNNLFSSYDGRKFPSEHNEESDEKKEEYYKQFAIQYITNEYTIKINQISDNINKIKNISFNETYILLFIISVIIIYSILLFFI